MTTVAENNLIPIIIAVLAGLVIAWLLFRRRKTDALTSTPEAAPLARTSPDTPEGNGLIDEGAAAATDVAGQFMGVEVHGELPGAEGPPDNLQAMKGVGPKFAALLNQNGITRFAQIARLSPAEVEALDAKLGAFSGRIGRDRIVDQAHYLARGDKDGFEAKFGKLGSAG
jgi:predicted flap endonuclease-1-like 5' DNA nuclease